MRLAEMASIIVHSIMRAPVALLGSTGLASGIAKRPAAEPIWLTPAGLAGDVQSDCRHHGGVDKSVHHYAPEHYAWWRDRLGDLSLLKRPGAFGENISTTGLNETTVAIGDTFAVGSRRRQGELAALGRRP